MKPSILSLLLLLFLSMALGLTSGAMAAEGVSEINAVCALQTGCFSGDTAGYPVTISQAGSYVLTSNLVLSNANQTGILVANDDVHINLNNFVIILSSCVGGTVSCRPSSGTGHGVDVDNTATRRAISVRNGSIVGMGLNGIRLSSDSEVRHVRSRWNRLNGISGQLGIRVIDSTVFQNGKSGISVLGQAKITGNTAYFNGDSGIDCGSGSVVSGNAAYWNQGYGIRTALGSTITGNATSKNSLDGIIAGGGSTISANAATDNGGDGIQASSGAQVQRNSVTNNGGYGLNLAADVAYRANFVWGNTTGTTNGGVNLGDNACNGTSSCP